MMLGMTACVAAAASLALLADRASADDRYLWPLWWLLWAGLNALLLSQDLFNLYVTLELVTLAGVGLVARSPGDPMARRHCATCWHRCWRRCCSCWAWPCSMDRRAASISPC
ncbi:hypothetical protein [Halomonas sp. E19]|uniref:hypothetical protein n=1 Tax=Halomonas sp. E19 TaxID=3397247 RepID=UPI00403315FD